MKDLSKKDILLVPPDKELPTNLISDVEKLPIVSISSNLGIKISENILYIVTKNGINVYSKDPHEVRVFQKIYEVYLSIWKDEKPH